MFVNDTAIKNHEMPRVVTMCDRMGDTKVVFKCATAVILCVLHAGGVHSGHFPVSAYALSIGKISVILPLPG